MTSLACPFHVQCTSNSKTKSSLCVTHGHNNGCTCSTTQTAVYQPTFIWENWHSSPPPFSCDAEKFWSERLAFFFLHPCDLETMSRSQKCSSKKKKWSMSTAWKILCQLSPVNSQRKSFCHGMHEEPQHQLDKCWPLPTYMIFHAHHNWWWWWP